MQDTGCMIQDARYGMPDMSPVALAKRDAGFRIGTWQLAVDKWQIARAQGSGFRVQLVPVHVPVHASMRFAASFVVVVIAIDIPSSVTCSDLCNVGAGSIRRLLGA